MMVPSLVLVLTVVIATQLAPRMESLIAAVRPVLPYPAATPDGDLPIDSGTDSKWFVVWPSDREETRIIVRANPLHPEVQKASAEAMAAINAAVTAAERRAQAAYDTALEQLRKTGKAGALENVRLDDEGVAGERIDAELEVTVAIEEIAAFDVDSGEPPVVQAGARGVGWIVSIPANTYRPVRGDDRRERFRAAETRLYFALTSRPQVSRRGDEPRFHTAVAASPDGFVVVIRGNAALVATLATGADWQKLVPR